MTNENLNTKVDQLAKAFEADTIELEALELEVQKLKNQKNAILADTTTLPSKLAKKAGVVELEIKDAQFKANIYRVRIAEIKEQMPELHKAAREAAHEAVITELHKRNALYQKTIEADQSSEGARTLAHALAWVMPTQDWEDIQRNVLGLIGPSSTEARAAAESLGITENPDVVHAIVDKFAAADSYDKIRAIHTQIDNKAVNGYYDQK